MGNCIGCRSKTPLPESDFQANLVETKSSNSYKDKYVLGRSLGEGITGCVKEVYAKGTKEKYAMKSINLARIDKAQMKELETEINLLKQLDHPNIIRIYEVYKSKRNIHIVMELLSGGELASRVLKTERQIQDVVYQLLSACKYWHSRGIVHRDLKLENIMFASKEQTSNVKVIDFGLGTTFATNVYRAQSSGGSSLRSTNSIDSDKSNKSRKSSPRRGSNSHNSSTYSLGYGKDQLSETKRMLLSTVGTAFYMSPEIVSGSGYTEACDLWAIGVITFMLITLKPPFPGASEKQIFKNLVYGSPNYNSSRWSKVSPEAKKFVKALLRTNPDDRMSADDALGHEWLLSRKREDNTNAKPLDNDVLMSLQRFTNYTRLRKAALMVVAHKSSAHNIQALRDAFLRLDVRHTGTITLEELKLALDESKLTLGDEEINNMFKGLDLDKSGHIRYLEFLAATVEAKSIITMAQFSEAFDHLDEDKSGFITHKNMRKLLGNQFSLEEIESIINECDLTGDMKVSRDEFIRMMNKESEKIKSDLIRQESSFIEESKALESIAEGEQMGEEETKQVDENNVESKSRFAEETPDSDKISDNRPLQEAKKEIIAS